MNFDQLIDRLRDVHERLADEAVRAVNAGLTLRNWLIGMHLYEFEQNGSDRAAYGERLVERVAERLAAEGLARTDARELRRYRQFYLTYPGIREALTPESALLLPAPIRETPTPESSVPGERLLRSLSFSHFAELLFVSKYQLELPDEAQMQAFLEGCPSETDCRLHTPRSYVPTAAYAGSL